MILSLLIYTLVAYLLYRLVFGFIIPIVRTTRRVKKSFRQMQEQMAGRQQAAHPYGTYGQQQTTVNQPARASDEDYIEFEEVK